MAGRSVRPSPSRLLSSTCGLNSYADGAMYDAEFFIGIDIGIDDEDDDDAAAGSATEIGWPAALAGVRRPSTPFSPSTVSEEDPELSEPLRCIFLLLLTPANADEADVGGSSDGPAVDDELGALGLPLLFCMVQELNKRVQRPNVGQSDKQRVTKFHKDGCLKLIRASTPRPVLVVQPLRSRTIAVPC